MRSYHSASISFIRFHLFQRGYFLELAYTLEHIVCLFFFPFSFVIFFLFLLTFAIRCALLLCSTCIYPSFSFSLALSPSFVAFFLYFCISLAVARVSARLCVCVNVYLYRSSTALSQKVASVLFATSWLPSKYSVDCTYIWKTFVWSSMKLCNSFFSSSLFCSFCPWFFRSAIVVLLFFIYLFCFMHLWACSLALPFLLPLTHTFAAKRMIFPLLSTLSFK